MHGSSRYSDRAIPAAKAIGGWLHGLEQARTRRTVPSSGARTAPVSGSGRTPSATSTSDGASAAHSPIARQGLGSGQDRAHRHRQDTSRYLRPRRSRGSGTPAKWANRSKRRSGPTSSTRPQRATIRATGEDRSAGTVFQHDHWPRHPHDHGNRACPVSGSPHPPRPSQVRPIRTFHYHAGTAPRRHPGKKSLLTAVGSSSDWINRRDRRWRAAHSVLSPIQIR